MAKEYRQHENRTGIIAGASMGAIAVLLLLMRKPRGLNPPEGYEERSVELDVPPEIYANWTTQGASRKWAIEQVQAAYPTAIHAYIGALAQTAQGQAERRFVPVRLFVPKGV